MKKHWIAVSLLTCCLSASSSFSQTTQWTCKAVRGNATQSWVWTSDSKNYSWHKVSQMCNASGANQCNITCDTTVTSAPSAPDSTYSCAVHGLYGHMWYGLGPTMAAAHHHALELCRQKGITPCTVDTCVRNQ